MQIVVGIITISDRASAGDYKDLGGPALKEVAQENEWQVLCEAVIPDDATKIQETVRSFSKQNSGNSPFVFETGLWVDSDDWRHRDWTA